LPLHYGFDDERWGRLAEAGYAYLAEVAGRGQTTSYPEFCAQLFDRTGLRVGTQDAALGALLADIAIESSSLEYVILPAVLLSAESGQPGAGFFTYAQEAGLLPKRASQDARLVFWAEHLKQVYAAYVAG
jgi:hypothetical protein